MPIIKVFHHADVLLTGQKALSERLIEQTRYILHLTETAIKPLVLFIACEYLSAEYNYYVEVAYRPAVAITNAQLTAWLHMLAEVTAPDEVFPVRLLKFANDDVVGLG